MHVLPTSTHSKKLRPGVIRGKFLRYLTLCSTEEDYNESCERLRKVLETRGYDKNEGTMGFKTRGPQKARRRRQKLSEI